MKHFFYSLLIVLLLCIRPLILSAQDSDIFKLIQKEMLQPDLSMDLSNDFQDSIFFRKAIKLDATKQYIPRLGFNYKFNCMLLFLSENQSFKNNKIESLRLPASYYYNLNSTETNGEVISNVVIYPIGSVILLNPVAFFDFLMRIGILPNDPLVPKMSRKERMLKTITQDVYHIDDKY